MSIQQINEGNIEEKIAKGLVLVDFWADWCTPCKMMAPILEEIDEELGNVVKITKMNVDENQEAAAKYDIMSLPTLLLFKNREEVDQLSGFHSKEALMDIIEKHSQTEMGIK